MRIAVVEDDNGVGDALVHALSAQRLDAVRMRRGSDILTRHDDVNVVLLDLGLPDADGVDVLRKLRAVSSVPVIVLTARGDERSIVSGLRAGADDYLVKPARLKELLARIDAVFRRASAAAGTAEVDTVEVGDVVIDLKKHEVAVAGSPVLLTQKEFDILSVLARSIGVAISREQLLDEVWGDAFVVVSRSLDVHMTSLRSKLDRPGLISTIRGFGYRLGA